MSCNCTDKLYVNNNNVVEWQTLTNLVTGLPDTGATVTLTITDNEGEEVTGETWPKSLSHVSGGTYRATLEYDLGITLGQRYTMTYNAIGSAGERGEATIVAVAERRGKTL